MEQDSNTENNSSAKKKLTLKKKPATSTPEQTPPAAPAPETTSEDKPKVSLSLKPKPSENSTPTPAEPAEPPTPAPKLPTLKPKAEEPKDTPPAVKLKATAPEPGPNPDPAPEPPAPSDSPKPEEAPPAPESTAKRIPIRVAEDPGDTPPPLPPKEKKEKKAPKAPPGVKIVSEEDAAHEPEDEDGHDPLLPPVITSPSTSLDRDEYDDDDDIDLAPLPPINPSAGLLDDEFSEVETKKKSINKDLFLVGGILIVLLAGVAFLAYGVLNLFKDDAAEGDTKAEPYEVTESEASSHVDEIAETAAKDSPKAPELDIKVREEDKVVATVDPDLPVIDYGHPDQPTLNQLPAGDRRPDPAIQNWIENLTSYAVRGDKIIIKNQTYAQGDIVSEELGLRWVGHKPKLKLLYFVDEYNVVYEKDY